MLLDIPAMKLTRLATQYKIIKFLTFYTFLSLFIENFSKCNNRSLQDLCLSLTLLSEATLTLSFTRKLNLKPNHSILVCPRFERIIFSQTPGMPLPSIEEPKGEYPTYITQESGKVVPVVQVLFHIGSIMSASWIFGVFPSLRLTATQSTLAS